MKARVGAEEGRWQGQERGLAHFDCTSRKRISRDDCDETTNVEHRRFIVTSAFVESVKSACGWYARIARTAGRPVPLLLWGGRGMGGIGALVPQKNELEIAVLVQPKASACTDVLLPW